MHKFIKSIGFWTPVSRSQWKEIETQMEQDHVCLDITMLDESNDFCEIKREYGERIGLCLCGITDECGEFHREYVFPYLIGSGITSYADVLIERRSDREAFIGICEDTKVGISLMFGLQNAAEYLSEQQKGQLPKQGTSLTLSGLCSHATVLLPILKDDQKKQKQKEDETNRRMLLSAAKHGDSQAIETLTLNDMEVFTEVSKRIRTEDLFSVVETYFMPYGVEADLYSILGEILEMEITENAVTKERVYILKLEVNELQFDVCVPEKGLTGEPAVGRRLKADILLQGRINF